MLKTGASYAGTETGHRWLEPSEPDAGHAVEGSHLEENLRIWPRRPTHFWITLHTTDS